MSKKMLIMTYFHIFSYAIQLGIKMIISNVFVLIFTDIQRWTFLISTYTYIIITYK